MHTNDGLMHIGWNNCMVLLLPMYQIKVGWCYIILMQHDWGQAHNK